MSTGQDLTVLPCTLEGKHFSSSSTKKRDHLNSISFCVCRRCTCSWSLRAFHYSQHRLPSSPSFPPSSDFSFIQGKQEQQVSTSVERYTWIHWDHLLRPPTYASSFALKALEKLCSSVTLMGQPRNRTYITGPTMRFYVLSLEMLEINQLHLCTTASKN